MRCSFRRLLALAAIVSIALLAGDTRDASFSLRVTITPPVSHLSAMLVGISCDYAEHKVTGSNGAIRFRQVPPGSYLVEIELANGLHLQRTAEVWPYTVNRKGEQTISLSAENAHYFPDRSSQVLQASFAGNSNSHRVLRDLDEAWKALREQRLDQAHCILRKLVMAGEDSADAWISLGAIAGRMGHIYASIQFYEQALLRNPASFRAFLNLSESFERAGRFQEAMPPALRAIEIRPKDLLARAHIAALYLQLRDYRAAAQHLSHALELDTPEADVTRLQFAVCLTEMGELDAALREFSLWLQLHPGHPRFLNIQGVCDEIRARRATQATSTRQP